MKTPKMSKEVLSTSSTKKTTPFKKDKIKTPKTPYSQRQDGKSELAGDSTPLGRKTPNKNVKTVHQNESEPLNKQKKPKTPLKPDLNEKVKAQNGKTPQKMENITNPQSESKNKHEKRASQKLQKNKLQQSTTMNDTKSVEFCLFAIVHRTSPVDSTYDFRRIIREVLDATEEGSQRYFRTSEFYFNNETKANECLEKVKRISIEGYGIKSWVTRLVYDDLRRCVTLNFWAIKRQAEIVKNIRKTVEGIEDVKILQRGKSRAGSGGLLIMQFKNVEFAKKADIVPVKIGKDEKMVEPFRLREDNLKKEKNAESATKKLKLEDGTATSTTMANNKEKNQKKSDGKKRQLEEEDTNKLTKVRKNLKIQNDDDDDEEEEEDDDDEEEDEDDEEEDDDVDNEEDDDDEEDDKDDEEDDNDDEEEDDDDGEDDDDDDDE